MQQPAATTPIRLWLILLLLTVTTAIGVVILCIPLLVPDPMSKNAICDIMRRYDGLLVTFVIAAAVFGVGTLIVMAFARFFARGQQRRLSRRDFNIGFLVVILMAILIIASLSLAGPGIGAQFIPPCFPAYS